MKADDVHGEANLHQVARVLASSGFARNDRMSRFLRFLVERHLEGRDEELKESIIAVEVFGRRPDYDPKQDSIVRTEAGRLRARLAEYYRGEGRLDPVVIDVPKGGYVPVFRPNEPVSLQGRAPSKGRGRLLLFACSAVVLTSAGWWWWPHDERASIRIAVLPFQNLSPDPTGDYFVDGLTDEIIRNLSIIEGLAVRSRTSSFVFKGQPRNVREAGRQLNADYLLEGSVLREDGQLRVNAQLVRARDDSSLWSGRFDRRLTGVFEIQDEIALGVVNNLRVQLGRGRRRYETSVEAYDLYLEARARFHDDQTNPPGVEDISAFERVIAMDPSFAPAYAGLASVYAQISIQFPTDHPPDELTKMRNAARRAIELDPLLAEAHAALALSDARESRWLEAEEHFRQAIDLDTNRSRTYFDFAMWLLFVVGRTEESLEQLRTAEAIDPLSSEVHRALASVLMSAGRYDDAAAHCPKMSADDSFIEQCLGRVRLGQGQVDEAIRILSADPGLTTNPQARGFLGHAYARGNRRDEAERMAAASKYANEQALIYAGLGDRDRTLDALERMTMVGPQRLGRYLHSPEFGFLRGDPRLSALRVKVGLPSTPGEASGR